jgi:hypothetical protein
METPLMKVELNCAFVGGGDLSVMKDGHLRMLRWCVLNSDSVKKGQNLHTLAKELDHSYYIVSPALGLSQHCWSAVTTSEPHSYMAELLVFNAFDQSVRMEIFD